MEGRLGSFGTLLKFVVIYQNRRKITGSDCKFVGAGTPVCMCCVVLKTFVDTSEIMNNASVRRKSLHSTLGVSAAKC